jgi:predicted transcriptional regulator
MSDDKRLRRAAGLTQHGLARKAHVAAWKIVEVESGHSHYSDVQRKRILRVLVEAIGKNIQALTRQDYEANGGDRYGDSRHGDGENATEKT